MSNPTVIPAYVTPLDEDDVEFAFDQLHLDKSKQPQPGQEERKKGYGANKKAYIYYYRPTKPEEKRWEKGEVSVQIADKPFAEGICCFMVIWVC